LQLNSFDTKLINSKYIDIMNKIGKVVKIKPPDNNDTWNDVGSREKQFGLSWKDIDKNGCDTRNDILKRDINKTDPESIEYIDDNKHCVVSKGTLYDPYTGLMKYFVRGKKTSLDVQIDHIIPLHLAWQEGAKQWTQEKREQLANDPDNLIAVDGKVNIIKSDGWCKKDICDINMNKVEDEEDRLYSFWMPPNRNYRCEYAKKQIDLHEKYELWLVPQEATTYKTTLALCSGIQSIDNF
jgi:hypothetical protein